jgi:hypothetical protein
MLFMDEEVYVMFHDDHCGELFDMNGKCSVCNFHPDMQSTAFKLVNYEELRTMLNTGRTFLGECRTAIVK